MKNLFSKISQIHAWFSWHQMSLFWYRSYRRVFLVLFTLTLLFGAWYWYYNLYQYAWDEQAKKKFLDSYAQETDFKETMFSKAVSSAQERQRKYESGAPIEHDLFRLDKIPKEGE